MQCQSLMHTAGGSHPHPFHSRGMPGLFVAVDIDKKIPWYIPMNLGFSNVINHPPNAQITTINRWDSNHSQMAGFLSVTHMKIPITIPMVNISDVSLIYTSEFTNLIPNLYQQSMTIQVISCC